MLRSFSKWFLECDHWVSSFIIPSPDDVFETLLEYSNSKPAPCSQFTWWMSVSQLGISATWIKIDVSPKENRYMVFLEIHGKENRLSRVLGVIFGQEIIYDDLYTYVYRCTHVQTDTHDISRSIKICNLYDDLKQKLDESSSEVKVVFVIWHGWLTKVKSGANLHNLKMSRGDSGKQEKGVSWEHFGDICCKILISF